MPGAPTRLRCEYLENPAGIDVRRPRLSWWVDDDRAAEIQTAYQIQAASTEAKLVAGDPDLWDSGHVSSRQTCNIEYRGRQLDSSQSAWWRVRTYDSDGMPSRWSEPGRFRMGMLSAEDWQAQWIGGQLTGSPSTPVPAVVMARDFQLHDQVSEAHLYITALGAYAAELNGHRVGEQPLTPAWQDYRKRVSYQILDVCDQLQTGNNRIGVLLGDGFYCGALGGGPRQQFGDRPWLYAQLVLRFAGGETRIIVSDENWQWRPSWLLRSDPFLGESIDGRQFLREWSVAGVYGDWYPVAVNHQLSPRLCVDMATPLRIGSERRPASEPVRRVDGRGQVRLLYDFGCNLVGRLRLRLKVPRGTAIQVRYAEAALSNGELVESPGSDPLAVDHYAGAGGEPWEEFQGIFGLHAFRHVEVSGLLEREAIVEIVALEVTSAAAAVGEFSSDHLLLNRFHQNVHNTLRHTFLGQPLAGFGAGRRIAVCADARAQMGVASCLFDVAALYRSWLSDMVDAQRPDGSFPMVVPPIPVPSAAASENAASGGDVALLVCAWSLYRRYGDRRGLEAVYPAIQRYLAGLRERRPDLIQEQDAAGEDPHEALLDAAWYCFALTLAARISGVLGRLGDLEAYEALRQRLRDRFRERFVTPSGLLTGDSQLAYLLALHLQLLEGSERANALQRLEGQLRRDGFHSGVDSREGALLLEVLTLEGRSDLAYQLLLQTSAPSWLHPVLENATSCWDEMTGELSRPAAGSVAEWLYTYLAGIELDPDLTPEQNAYRAVIIQPHPPLGIGFAAGPPVRRVAAAMDTINGRYESTWELGDQAFVLKVRVPCNCSARVIMPDEAEHHVMAGAHEFTLRFDQAGDGIPILREVSQAS
jgi:alpha-L-rhamnosidase